MDPLQRVHLRIVPIDRVLPHEIADPGRESRILRRLQEDGLLRDPLMVGGVPGVDGYVLLDGTNRRRALQALGHVYTLVQVVDYAGEGAVTLRTWCHLVALPQDEIVAGARIIPGLSLHTLDPLAVTDALGDRRTLAVIGNPDALWLLRRNDEPGLSRAQQLRALVDRYEAHLTRVDCTAEDVEEQARTLAPQDGLLPSLVAFPALSRAQVVTMASRAALIPAGITRHIILVGRALRVNLPLDLLSANLSLDEANARLNAHLATLQPRVYREPTILFDS